MCDEESLHRYGTPLPALDEDNIPTKKYVEDQIVTDENGRRRFHGAFTGGFSAGYWNTVGSQEGWTPQSFKSSRSEKAEQRKLQRPQDFMDDEDLGEFGIAPTRFKTHADFAPDNENEGRKRKLAPANSGPIPGEPVLHQLLKPKNDKVAVRMLKYLGWRPGQGAGPRQTRKEKKRARQRNRREMYIMQQYGYEPGEGPPMQAESEDGSSSSSSDGDDDEITFAPDDYDPFICKPKTNFHGLGYTDFLTPSTSSGAAAAAATTSQHVNLFAPLEVLDKNNKKLSISGQAFGVGALEEDDEDIYARDDMTQYDFSLENRRKPKKKVQAFVQDRAIIEGFVAAQQKTVEVPLHIVDLPKGYEPRDWTVRKSRFTPLPPEKARELEVSMRLVGLGRHDLLPEERGRLLGEGPAVSVLAKKTGDADIVMNEEQPTTSARAKTQPAKPADASYRNVDKTKQLLELISARSSNFTRGGIITSEGEEQPKPLNDSVETALLQENQDLLEKARSKTKHLATTSGTFKPFLNDDAKQNRYEKFLAENLHTETEISNFLTTIQPMHLPEWGREMEKKEFIQARNMYKPLAGLMLDRFITETAIEAVKTVTETKKEDAKNKIVMERTKSIWKPAALLCKRYNIAEPYGGSMVEQKKPHKSKLSVFDYLETSINTKADFQTPVIIPKHIEKPKAIIKDTPPPPPIKNIETVVVAEATPDIPTTSTKDVKAGRHIPKTELEKQVEASIDKPIWEKRELYKAIFEDSSDDEEATDTKAESKNVETETASKNEEIDQTSHTLAKPITAAAANLLRNTSPPRGIFAALFTPAPMPIEKQTDPPITSAAALKIQVPKPRDNAATSTIPDKIIFKSKSERFKDDNEIIEKNEEVEVENDIYGPKIPEHIKKPTTSIASVAPKAVPESDIDNKLVRLWEKQKSSKLALKTEGEWIEKTAATAIGIDDSSSMSSSSSSSNNLKRKKKSKKSKKKTTLKIRDRKHKKKDKKKSKKQDKSHKSKKSKKS